MVEITKDEIDSRQVLDAVADVRAGAQVLFLGTTREFTDGRRTTALEYECYPEMARKKLQELHQQACSRWPIVKCAIVHRIGQLGAGDVSVAIAVSTAHRQDAFAAGNWLIDTLKKVVPIWKKEKWADGECTWVHPNEDAS